MQSSLVPTATSQSSGTLLLLQSTLVPAARSHSSGLPSGWQSRLVPPVMSHSSGTAADFQVGTWDMIIIPEGMHSGSLPTMHTLVDEMEDYVTGGGVLVDMIAASSTRRWSQGVPGPFGTVTNSTNGTRSYVAVPNHEMVAGMSLPYISGSADHHAQIVVPPTDSIAILTAGTSPGGIPTACWLSFSEEDWNASGSGSSWARADTPLCVGPS